MLVGDVAHQLAVAEVDQLQHRGHHAPQPPQHQGVELHLEQRAALEARSRCATGLVVHHPDRTVGGDVDAVHEAAQQELGVEQPLDVQLALGRLQTRRVLQGEVALEHRPAGVPPPVAVDAALAVEDLGQGRLVVEEAVPRGLQHLLGADRGALHRGQVEEVLEHLVHQRAAHRVGRRRLGQLVDGAEAVEQRAGHEVPGPAGGQGAQHVDAVHGGRVALGRAGRRDRPALLAVQDLRAHDVHARRSHRQPRPGPPVRPPGCPPVG